MYKAAKWSRRLVPGGLRALMAWMDSALGTVSMKLDSPDVTSTWCVNSPHPRPPSPRENDPKSEAVSWHLLVLCDTMWGPLETRLDSVLIQAVMRDHALQHRRSRREFTNTRPVPDSVYPPPPGVRGLRL
jgi:hypothetical protein